MHALQSISVKGFALWPRPVSFPDELPRQCPFHGKTRSSISAQPSLRDDVPRPAIPSVLRTTLPVRGKDCKSTSTRSIWFRQGRRRFNLCCSLPAKFGVKLSHSHFGPKLTMFFIRSRLGEVPPLRPLVYLLDGT